MSEKRIPPLHFYVNGSEESKKVLSLVKNYSPEQYAIHREPEPKHDRKKKRPYMLIGDPDGTPLGPTSNITTMKRDLEILAKA